MTSKPTYEELESRVRELEQAQSEPNQAAAKKKIAEDHLQDLVEKERLERITLETLIDTTPVGVVVSDLDGNISFHNKTADEIVGGSITGDAYRPASGYQLAYLDGTPYLEEDLPLIRATLHNDQIRDAELLIRRDDGTDIVVLVNATPLRDEKGQTRGAVATLQDISDRAQAEKALRESEKRAELSAEFGGIGLWDLDLTGHTVWRSFKHDQIFGYESPPPEWTFDKFLDHVVDEDRPMVERTFSDALEKSHPWDLEFQIKRRDGSRRWVWATGDIEFDANHQPKKMAGIVQDITDRKNANRETLILKTAIDLAPVGIALADEDINIYFCNPEGLGMRGGEIDDLIEIPKDAFENWRVYKLDGEPYEIENLPLVRAVRNGEVIREKFIVKNQDGTDHICDAVACPVFEDRKIIAGMVTFLDITAREEFEALLRKSEERLQLAIKGSNDALWDWDLITDEMFYSPQWWVQIGYAQNELPTDACLWRRLLHPEDADRVNRILQDALQDGSESYEIELRLMHKEGHAVPVLARGFISRNVDGTPIRVSGTNMDLTERKRLDKALQQAQKMKAVGTLAGGIAHDFNNILTGPMGDLQLLLLRDDLSTDVRNEIERTFGGLRRAKGLTTQLLTFSKGGMPIKESASIEELVRETTRLSLHGSNVKPEFEFEPHLSPVNVDAGQIGQVIQNLVINADQAMQNGGKLKISAQNVQIDDNVFHPIKSGAYIRVTVEDSGVGIPDDALPLIFDPFYTTKPDGNGLGLAISYSIVSKHDGYITARSERSIGTIFDIYLPVAYLPVKEGLSQASVDKDLTGKRILVMDDEPIVRTVVGRMLESFHADVDCALDGKQVLELYQLSMQANSSYDLVLMDLTVPGGMGGLETVIQLLQIDDQARAVVMSGYANDRAMADYRKYGFYACVKKPIDMEELITAVKFALSL